MTDPRNSSAVNQKNARRWKGIFISPSRQFKYASTAVLIGLVTFVAFFTFELWLISALISHLSAFVPPDSPLNQLLIDCIRWSWVAFIFTVVAFSLLVFSATIIVSHRLYGPIYAMRRHVEALVRGEYSHRVHLRKTDEFKDLAEVLNELSSNLEAGKAGSGSLPSS